MWCLVGCRRVIGCCYRAVKAMNVKMRDSAAASTRRRKVITTSHHHHQLLPLNSPSSTRAVRFRWLTLFRFRTSQATQNSSFLKDVFLRNDLLTIYILRRFSSVNDGLEWHVRISLTQLEWMDNVRASAVSFAYCLKRKMENATIYHFHLPFSVKIKNYKCT